MQDLTDFSARTSTMQNSEPFWPMAAARKLRMAMTVVFKAKGKCSISDVYQFCTTMPNVPGMVKPTKPEEIPLSQQWQQTYCCECLLEARNKCRGDPDLALAADFVLLEWPRLSDRTGGSIDAYVMNTLEKFVHGSVRELVASDATNLTPQDVLNGKLLVVDMPILKYREPGQFVQMTWKLMVQRAALRRAVTSESRDACIWADEAQLHALPSVDSMVQAVARSHRLIQVAITQNIPLLVSVLKSREDVMAWVSNLQSKFIFSNADVETNNYFSQLFGQSIQQMGGGSIQMGNNDPWADWMGTQQSTATYSSHEQWLPDVRAEDFTRLRKGGEANDCLVDFYFTQGGRMFSNGKTFIRSTLPQVF